MWPFRKKPRQPPITEAQSAFLSHPRYGKNPIALFFEAYILSVIRYLPEEWDKQIQAMDIGSRLQTKATAWREVVKEALHLSETIDVSILDLWYRNRAILEQRGYTYEPKEFARDFVDQYNTKNSRVDVWPAGALEAARARIKAHEEAGHEAGWRELP
jgi:hypothetical protein